MKILFLYSVFEPSYHPTCKGERSTVIRCKSRNISSMKGSVSPACTMTKCLRHFCAILMNVSQAMSCTPKNQHERLKQPLKGNKGSQPSWVSCMNSKSLLTTVLRNFQCAFKNRGYWPTIYIIFAATTALLSFPRFISHNPSRSLMTVTRNRFSVSSSEKTESK